MNHIIFYSLYNLGLQSAAVAKFFVFCAGTLPYIVILATAGYLGYKKIFPPKIFLVYVIAFGAWVLAGLIKLLIHAPRPFVLLSDVTNLIPESGYAFPSGHATFFMAFAVAVFLLEKKAGYVLMAAAVLIGIARVVVGVHFPGDVLGGFALGALFAYSAHHIVYTLTEHFFPPHEAHGGHH